jgi:hypothetical protein
MIGEKEYLFDEKNDEGKEFELFCLNEIREKKYPQALIDNPDKKFEYWDIYVNEGIQIECKNDIEAATTNNICIEVAQDGRPSGVKITKAKYWLHCDGIRDGNEMFLAKTEKILELLDIEYNNKLQRFINKENKPGETLNFNGIQFQSIYPVNQGRYTKYMDWYLIPKTIFAKYCLEVTDIGEMTYKNMI